jgi:hypothetical protein
MCFIGFGFEGLVGVFILTQRRSLTLGDRERGGFTEEKSGIWMNYRSIRAYYILITIVWLISDRRIEKAIDP